MRILWLSLLVLTLLQLTHTQDQTTIIFYYQHEDEQQEDYLKISLEVETQGASLTKTINDATSTVAEIKTLAMDYCKNNKAKKADCKQAAQIERFQIEPKYQKIRREDSFSTFVVSHQVTVNVYNAQRVGSLVDSLLKLSGVKLQGFEWAPFEEVNPEEAAIKAGLQEAEGLCEQLGLQLGRVVDVQEIIGDPFQQQKGGEEEEQEEEQEQQKVVYKLEVQCVKGAKK